MRPGTGLAIVLSCAAGEARAGDSASAAALAAAAFATPPPYADEAVGPLAERASFADGTPADWRSSEVKLSRKSGAVDSLRVSLAEPALAQGRPLRVPGRPYATPAYEVSLIRNWPGAVSLETRSFGVDVTPHAGLGMSSDGGVAEAGATVRVSQKLDTIAKERLEALGIRDGTTAMADQGRWYIFAAASGRAVGLNMLHGEGGWDRAGWTTDPSSRLVGDAQLGVGWRKGAMQTSVGLIHREIKGDYMIFGQKTEADSLVAFSFAVRPQQ
jgi:hypothetical protein